MIDINLSGNADLTIDGTDYPDSLQIDISLCHSGTCGTVYRLPDGRLLTIIAASGVPEGTEDTVKVDILSQLPSTLLKSHLTDLGLDDGLEAWATE